MRAGEERKKKGWRKKQRRVKDSLSVWEFVAVIVAAQLCETQTTLSLSSSPLCVVPMLCVMLSILDAAYFILINIHPYAYIYINESRNIYYLFIY